MSLALCLSVPCVQRREDSNPARRNGLIIDEPGVLAMRSAVAPQFWGGAKTPGEAGCDSWVAVSPLVGVLLPAESSGHFFCLSWPCEAIPHTGSCCGIFRTGPVHGQAVAAPCHPCPA